MAESRHFAVLDGDSRVDLVAPGSMTLGEALDSAGVRRARGRLQVLGRHGAGQPAVLSAPVAALDDGALLTVVDPGAVIGVRASEAPHEAGRHVAGLWWGQAAAGLAVVALVLTRGPVAWPVATALVLGAAAGGGAVAAVRRTPVDGGARAARVAGPVMLGVAAVVVVTPSEPVGGVHLLVVVAALAAATLLVLAVAADSSALSRRALGVAAVVCGVVAAVWGAVLALGWDPRVGAAVVAGAVPLALRALPSVLVPVADGDTIDVERYQDTRWSVRDWPGPGLAVVDARLVDRTTRGAVVARAVGTVLLSVLGAAALPFAVPDGPASGVVRGGQAGLLVCYAAAMTMLGRSAGVRHLHWVPRGSAVVAVAVGARSLLGGLSGSALALGALGALAAGLVAGALAVLVGRGARSLVLSRVGDLVEALGVALCLPAGLLAGDIVEAIRTVVAS